MMSPANLSTHKLLIWTAGFVLEITDLEVGTHRLYQDFGQKLPFLVA
jgi:hypothetical protein